MTERMSERDWARLRDREIGTWWGTATQEQVAAELDRARAEEERLRAECEDRKAYGEASMAQRLAEREECQEIAAELDRLREVAEELYKAMIDYGMEVDGDAPPRHVRMMNKAHNALYTTGVSHDDE